VPATLDAGVRQIQCVADALDFLNDWPADQRGIMFDMTQDALYRHRMVACQHRQRGRIR